jgi:hypothetical protein
MTSLPSASGPPAPNGNGARTLIAVQAAVSEHLAYDRNEYEPAERELLEQQRRAGATAAPRGSAS